MSKAWQALLALVMLLFSTAPFAQVTVEVEIDGLDQKLEENVRLYLSIEQQKEHPLLSDGRLFRLHQKAVKEIKAALQPYGYYRPTIGSDLQKDEEGLWRAIYSIDPGPELRIAVFSFTISESMGQDPDFQQLIQERGLKTGDAFTHIDYERFKSGLAKLAEELGYFRTEFVEHRVEIDLDDYVARVFLNIDGGPRYHFGEISWQQDALEEEFLLRYMPFQKDDPYSLDKLVALQRTLNDTRYFQTVEVSPGRASPDSTEIPVEVKLTPRKNNRYEAGVGYGTDSGARTRIGWERPRVNKKGHRFDSSLGLSEIGHNFEANYRVPILNPRTDQLVYSVTDSKEELDDYDSELRTVGVSLNRKYSDWRETLAIDYEREKFEIGNDNDETTLVIPGASWSRIWGDNFIFVLDGLRFDFGVRGSGEDLGSDAGFVQGYSRIKFISSLSRDNRIIARGSIGSTSTDEFSQLPPSVRFFTGGSQSVRGYKYQSLGPEDDSGDVIGGQRLLVGSLEFDHALNDRWGLAVFYDAGNAMEEFSDDLEHGAGFGIRWNSPIGPVRIDLASALSKDGDPWRLHLNIGPDL